MASSHPMENKGETNKDTMKPDTDCKKIDDELKSSAADNRAAIESGAICKKSDNVSAEIGNAIVAPDEALKNVLQFAKDNHLKYKRNNTYCKVCNVKISSSLKRLKEHVAEQSHKDKAVGFMRDAGVVVPKVELIEFIDSEFEIQNFFLHEIVINEKFCLSYASYETIIQRGAMIRCQTCEVSMDRNEVGLHVRMWQHERGKQTASVLVAYDTEFLREIRPGVYHCGFCNFIEGSIKGMKNHLKSISHRDQRSRASFRLINHMSDIMDFKRKHAVRQFIMRGMMNLFL